MLVVRRVVSGQAGAGAALRQRLSHPLDVTGPGQTAVKWSVVRHLSGGQWSNGCHTVLFEQVTSTWWSDSSVGCAGPAAVKPRWPHGWSVAKG